MGKVSKIWLYLALIFLGFSGGILVGVIVDVDTKYEMVVKKIKSKKSSGDLVIDVTSNTDELKTKKEIRLEKKEARQIEREIRKASRRN